MLISQLSMVIYIFSFGFFNPNSMGIVCVRTFQNFSIQKALIISVKYFLKTLFLGYFIEPQQQWVTLTALITLSVIALTLSALRLSVVQPSKNPPYNLPPFQNHIQHQHSKSVFQVSREIHWCSHSNLQFRCNMVKLLFMVPLIKLLYMVLWEN